MLIKNKFINSLNFNILWAVEKYNLNNTTLTEMKKKKKMKSSPEVSKQNLMI